MIHRCVGVKGNGERCGQAVAEPGDYCIWHDPDRKKEALAVRSLGGKRAARTNAARRKVAREDQVPSGPPETAAEAQRFASWATLGRRGGADRRGGWEEGEWSY